MDGYQELMKQMECDPTSKQLGNPKSKTLGILTLPFEHDFLCLIPDLLELNGWESCQRKEYKRIQKL